MCGDLQIEPGEQCDIESEGCLDCQVVAGFTCDDRECKPTCGDGLRVGTEECDPPDGVSCDSACRSGQKQEACDMTGYWLARQTDFSIDTVLNQVQTSSNWYVYELVQTGDSFEVQRNLSCGIWVTGSATVELTPPGIRGLLYQNPQDLDTPAPRSARRGTFTAQNGGCNFTMDRHYFVRGLGPEFLPADFSTKPELDTLIPLPFEETPANPTGKNTAGATDPDNDGQPGILYRIFGNANGNRSVVQRDFYDYFTEPDALVPPNSIEFTARSVFKNQENILSVTGCPRVGCGILLAGSEPAPNLKGRVRFRYLGKSLDDPRVSSVVAGPLKQDEATDLQTCANVRASLPHDPAKQ